MTCWRQPPSPWPRHYFNQTGHLVVRYHLPIEQRHLGGFSLADIALPSYVPQSDTSYTWRFVVMRDRFCFLKQWRGMFPLQLLLKGAWVSAPCGSGTHTYWTFNSSRFEVLLKNGYLYTVQANGWFTVKICGFLSRLTLGKTWLSQ